MTADEVAPAARRRRSIGPRPAQVVALYAFNGVVGWLVRDLVAITLHPMEGWFDADARGARDYSEAQIFGFLTGAVCVLAYSAPNAIAWIGLARHRLRWWWLGTLVCFLAPGVEKYVSYRMEHPLRYW